MENYNSMDAIKNLKMNSNINKKIIIRVNCDVLFNHFEVLS